MNQDIYKNIRFCLYARKSQSREDRQVVSIESQVREVKEFAKKMGFKIHKMYEDAASAHKPNNRPAFKQMMEDLEGGEVNAILTWKPDRIARNMVEAGVLIHALQTGVFELIQTPYSRYLPTDNMLPLIIEMGMANQFSLDLSKNIKRGNKTKIQNGGFCSKAPIGYKNCKETRNVIKDPDTFKKVQKLFKMYLTEKYSLKQLAHESEKMGLVGNIGKKPLSGGGVHQILKNPFYYGYIKYTEHEAWGNHEAMITPLEHKKIMGIFKKLGRLRDTNCEFAYSGLMKCGECGHSVTAEEKVKYKCPDCNKKQTAKHPKKCSCGYMITQKDIQRGKFYTYYHCAKPKAPCAKKFVNAKILDPQFEEFVSRLSLDEDYLKWAEPWMKFMEGEIKNETETSEAPKNENEDIEKKLSDLLDMRINGEIDAETFRKKKTELEQKKRIHEEQKQTVVQKTKAIREEILYLIDLEKRYKNTTLKEQKHILKKLSSNPQLTGEKVHVKAKKLYTTFGRLRKHKKADMKPTKNRSESGLSANYGSCYHMWYCLYKLYETQ